MLFDSFEFDRRLLRAVDHIGWDMPTPVQEEAIPVALSGRDLLACARTGSGKTGGFVLPALQRLLNEEPRSGRGSPACSASARRANSRPRSPTRSTSSPDTRGSPAA